MKNIHLGHDKKIQYLRPLDKTRRWPHFFFVVLQYLTLNRFMPGCMRPNATKSLHAAFSQKQHKTQHKQSYFFISYKSSKYNVYKEDHLLEIIVAACKEKEKISISGNVGK